MIKNQQILADRLKGIKVNGEDISLEKLTELLSDKTSEVELSADPVHLLNETQLTDLKASVKKVGYEEGKLAGSEMQMKRLKEITGIEIDGFKDPEKFLTSYQNKVLADAKIEPEKKVRELTESLTTLQNTYKAKEQEWAQQLTQRDQTISSIKSEAVLLQTFPKIEGYKTSHILAAFKSDGYGVAFDESGSPYPVKNGSPIKNELEQNLDINTVVSEWLTSSGFSAKTPDGRGDGNKFPAGGSQFKTEADLFKYMEQNKINPDSAQGREMLDKFYGKK